MEAGRHFLTHVVFFATGIPLNIVAVVAHGDEFADAHQAAVADEVCFLQRLRVAAVEKFFGRHVLKDALTVFQLASDLDRPGGRQSRSHIAVFVIGLAVAVPAVTYFLF